MDDFYKINYFYIKKYLKNNKKIISILTYNKNLYKIDDQIIKIFDLYMSFYEKYFLFCQINVESFAFPKELIVYNDQLMGYIMKYISGETFNSLNKNIIIKNFLFSLYFVERDINIISKNHIKINDLHSDNIIYNVNNNKTVIIDVDDYQITMNSYDELLDQNIYYFKLVINSLLFPNYRGCDDIIFNKEKSIVDVYNEAIIFLQNKFDKNINTLNDLSIINNSKNKKKALISNEVY